MTQESNLKTCSRCHSTMLLEFYDKNRKGEYYKLCNNCRHKNRETAKTYYDNNFDTVYKCKERFVAKCRANPLECSKCGKSVLKYMVARHQATYTCQTFGMENKPTWDEWEKQRLDELAKLNL